MLVRKLVVPFGLVLASSGFAADAVKFHAEQGVLNWTQANTEVKPDGGTAAKAKTDSMETMPNSLELRAEMDKMAFYMYPTDASRDFGFGYYAMPELEVGITLGIDSNKVDKPKTESADNSYGLGVTYYLPVGANSVELGLGFSMSSGTDKSTDATTAVETKTTSTGSTVSLGATYVLALAKNFDWTAGIGYSSGSEEDKVGTAKVKTTSTAMALNLTTFRVKF